MLTVYSNKQGITFEAKPAPMGWRITAEKDGETYTVEAGFSGTPDKALSHWLKRADQVDAAIAKAKARAKPQTPAV